MNTTASTLRIAGLIIVILLLLVFVMAITYSASQAAGYTVNLPIVLADCRNGFWYPPAGACIQVMP